MAFAISFTADAQIPDDLSGYKASMITDDQLRSYIEQAGKAGLSETQIVEEVRRRGLPEAEVAIFRSRLRDIVSANTKTAEGTVTNEEKKGRNDLPAATNPGLVTNAPPSARVFGAELFSNTAISFEPNLRMPTPANYRLGPDDQLIVDVFGINQTQQTQTVSPEGAIKLNYVGPIFVNGLSVEEARNRIIAKLSSVYPAIRSGGTKVQVSLGAIRSIKVTILGSVVKPGTYTLPSLATLFNALYSSGGPDENGSFRSIELIRNSKVVETVDIYRFLLNGDQSQNVRLEDMDVIRIPIAKTKVQVNGQVIRQGIFELLPGETLGELINNYTGGFLRTAYTAIIRSERITDRERKLIDITKDEIPTFLPQDGDVYNIDKILERYENAVSINGAVFRPGRYSFLPGMTVRDLITKADGLKEDVYTERVLLYRLKEDQTKEIISFNLTEALNNNEKNLMLRKDDELVISSIYDLKDEYNVTVGGAVRKGGSFVFREGLQIKDMIQMAGGLREDAFLGRAILTRTRADNSTESFNIALGAIINGSERDIYLQAKDQLTISSSSDLAFRSTVSVWGAVNSPGSFPYADNLTLKNIILQAGGFTDMASLENIEIARRRNFVDPNDPFAKLSDIMPVALDTFELSIDQQDFKIEPFDIVTIKTNPFKKPQEIVTLEGQLYYPGPYTILNRQERLSSIISRAGFPLAEANISGARLKRLKRDVTLLTEDIDKMSKQAKDSTGLLVSAASEQYDEIALDLNEALRKPGGEADIFVQAGDIINIPRKDEMVNIEGEVMHPIKLAYERGKGLRYYINAAGGFVNSANKKKVFVVYANGKAARTKKFLFFRNYPDVEQGSQIFVPKYIPEEKPKKSAAEVMATVSAVATLSYLIVYIVNQIK